MLSLSTFVAYAEIQNPHPPRESPFDPTRVLGFGNQGQLDFARFRGMHQGFELARMGDIITNQ